MGGCMTVGDFLNVLDRKTKEVIVDVIDRSGKILDPSRCYDRVVEKMEISNEWCCIPNVFLYVR